MSRDPRLGPPVLFANDLNTKPTDQLAIAAMVEELNEARKIHGSFASCHEGLGVILEEFIELAIEVFKKREQRDLRKIRLEAVQLGAMATKLAGDAEELLAPKIPAPSTATDTPPPVNAGASHCPDGQRHVWQYWIETDGFRCRCGAEILPSPMMKP